MQLCLPLVIIEALLQQVVDRSTEPDSFPGVSVIVGLLVYPLYTAALILFLDARSRGNRPVTAICWQGPPTCGRALPC